MFKKILYIIILFIINILYTFAADNNIEINNTLNWENNDILNVLAVLKDDEWTSINYMDIYIKNNNNIICQWKTEQTFENIVLNDWKKSQIMKVKDNGVAKFNCPKKDLLLWNKLNPNIKLVIRSDWFFDISNWEIVLSINNFDLVDNKIIIWNYKQANFKVLLTYIWNQYANIYDNDIKNIKDKLLSEEKRKKELKDGILNTKQIDFIIENIPEDIKEIPYNFVWTDYIYKTWEKNKLYITGNNVPDIILWKGNVILSWLIIKDNKLVIKYNDNFIEKDVILKISIEEIPEYSIDIPIKIDDFNYIYKKWFSYKLSKEQVKNWILLSIWEKKYKKLKILKTDEIILKYSDVVNKVDIIKKETFDNNFLAIELDNKYLDPLGRFSYFAELENGWIKNIVIESNKILKSKEKFIIKEFIWKEDIIPINLIINGEKINLKTIALNYNEFIKNRFK